MGTVTLTLILPGVVVLLYRKIKYPSPLVCGSILGKVVPARAHLVLDYNKQLVEEKAEGRVGRKGRSQQFKVNWGYLLSETKNTTLFLQILRFEKLKIKESKRGLQYDSQEMAIVALIART